MIANCFNPRTPCGVRPGAGRILFFHAGFNPRTPCGVRQVASGKGFPFLRFNPRTPCGVRRVTFQHTAETRPFQSTHSLRSATSIRSRLLSLCVVSIHALLAECDQIRVQDIPGIRPFQSTHSLRSATGCSLISDYEIAVSIHALLAECDGQMSSSLDFSKSFNPRTPCGVRPKVPPRKGERGGVSIHALLAECDATDFIHYYSTEQIILCANLPKKTVIARLHFLSIYLSIFYSQCITPIADLPGNSCELEVGAQAMFHSL